MADFIYALFILNSWVITLFVLCIMIVLQGIYLERPLPTSYIVGISIIVTCIFYSIIGPEPIVDTRVHHYMGVISNMVYDAACPIAIWLFMDRLRYQK